MGNELRSCKAISRSKATLLCRERQKIEDAKNEEGKYGFTIFWERDALDSINLQILS